MTCAALAAALGFAAGASAQTLTTLANFSGSNGANPGFGHLIADPSGNLLGTTANGGTAGAGVVFEIAKTGSGYSSTPITLYNFTGPDGKNPLGGLIADADGNLFGTTSIGGANLAYGTVFEIAKTSSGYSSTATTLFSFNGSNGSFPVSGLIADAQGNLFGTTATGGAFWNGTVFEVAKTGTGYAAAPDTLFSFNSPNSAPVAPYGGLMIDASGNLFGTTTSGAFGYGGVFELAKTSSGYSSTITSLDGFTDSASGDQTLGALLADSDGNLLGTTAIGGPSGFGTVFMVKNFGQFYGGLAVVVAFDKTNGSGPTDGLLADANGNLFGTTGLGGTNNLGTIFKIAKTSAGYDTTPTVLYNFDGVHGANPQAGLIADTQGNLFGTTSAGGTNNGTVFELVGSGFVPPVHFAGTPGTPGCVGTSISSLARTYGGIARAATDLGYPSVAALQNAVAAYCGQ